MRELVSYDGWFVPGGWAASAFGTNVFERACSWGQQSSMPPGHLWMFTDPEAGERMLGRGRSLGFYVGGCRGSQVFEHLPQGLTAIEINPGSSPEMAWFIGGEGVALSRQLGKAIALEQAFVTRTNLVDRLLDFQHYWVFVTPAGAIATAVGEAGMQNPGMIFTTTDCRDAAIKAFGAGAAALKPAVMTGEAIFGQFEKFGIDGLLLNLAGPAPGRPLPREACLGIAKSLRDRAEIARLEALANGES